jgi:signal peptidase I
VVLREGIIYIYNNDNLEGFMLDESSYLPVEVKTTPLGESTIALASDEYFLLGDNRTRSMDSRQFGSVNKDLIVGRAIIRGYPFDRWQTFFSSPLY